MHRVGNRGIGSDASLKAARHEEAERKAENDRQLGRQYIEHSSWPMTSKLGRVLTRYLGSILMGIFIAGIVLVVFNAAHRVAAPPLTDCEGEYPS